MLFLIAFAAYYTFCLAFCYLTCQTLLAKEQISVSPLRLAVSVLVTVPIGFIIAVPAMVKALWSSTTTWGQAIARVCRGRALASAMIDEDPALQEALREGFAQRIRNGEFNVVQFPRKKDGTDGE